MTQIKVYPGGPFQPKSYFTRLKWPDWRDNLEKEASQHDYSLDPRNPNKGRGAGRFVGKDLQGVEECDLFFLYHPKYNTHFKTKVRNVDVGGPMEAMHAYDRNKFIVVANEVGFHHPFLPYIADRHFATLEEAVDYMKDLRSLEEEFKTIMKHL